MKTIEVSEAPGFKKSGDECNV